MRVLEEHFIFPNKYTQDKPYNQLSRIDKAILILFSLATIDSRNLFTLDRSITIIAEFLELE